MKYSKQNGGITWKVHTISKRIVSTSPVTFDFNAVENMDKCAITVESSPISGSIITYTNVNEYEIVDKKVNVTVCSSNSTTVTVRLVEFFGNVRVIKGILKINRTESSRSVSLPSVDLSKTFVINDLHGHTIGVYYSWWTHYKAELSGNYMNVSCKQNNSGNEAGFVKLFYNVVELLD